MKVTLPADLEDLVERLVTTGRYGSAQAVLETALRRLDEDDRHNEWLCEAVAVGVEAADRGDLASFDETTLERVKTEGRQRLAGAHRQQGE